MSDRHPDWGTGPFSLEGRVAVVVGASGAIGQALARGVGEAGARVALLARRPGPLAATAASLSDDGIDAAAWPTDVLNSESLVATRDAVLARWDTVDLLLNVAGGNVASATLSDERSPFGVDISAYRDVLDLNFYGTIAAINIFGPTLASSSAPDRAIVNISSMAAARAVTRVGGYGAAKAALESFTRSLAVELARRRTSIRVNAIAPGFIVGEQNRALILKDDGTPTERGRTIIDATPLGRFCEPWELASTAVWLCGPASRFVTGVVVPVDGGFSAFSGV